jgi:hypothetical protein
VVDGLTYLKAEKGTQAARVASKDKYLNDLVGKLTTPSAILKGVLALINPDILLAVFKPLQASISDSTKPFVVPQAVWGMLESASGIIGYTGPITAVSLRVPAISPAQFFANPIADIKTGLLPHFETDGRFTVESEQEKWTDTNKDKKAQAGEFEDTGVDGFVDLNNDGVADFAGRPGAGDGIFNDYLGLTNPGAVAPAIPTLPDLKHKTPFGTIDAGNGIVDPIYLFFGNASMNGMLIPVKPTGNVDTPYAADTTKTYTNAELAGLVSSIVWMINGL